MLVDQEARERIATDFETNLLVEASAGSGKTYALVQRLVNGLVAGVYRVGELAVVTFTRKAAAELSGRLRLALQAENSPAAESALENIEKMFVGTVHSFCARLIREHPVQAGISPGFRELEEAEDLLLSRRVLRLEFEKPEGRRLQALLAEFGIETKELIPALQMMSEHGELDYPFEDLERPDLVAGWSRIDEFGGYLETQLPECDEAEPSCKLLVASRSLLNLRSVASRDSSRDFLRALGEWESEPKPVKKYWGEKRADQNLRLDAVLEKVTEFRQWVEDELGCWRAFLYGQCVPFLLKVREACQLERQRSGLVNFNDLLRLSCKLVRDSVVRAEIQQRWRRVFVDEFQDTDPMQAELFFLMSSRDVEQGDWSRCQLRAGSLFLVGDPKQSIYRFRRADIETYNTARRRIVETNGGVLSLETSFRSTPALCDWINSSFQALLPEQPTAQQARFGSVSSSQQPQPLKKPAVSRLLQAGPHNQCSQSEAREIAKLILEWIQQGFSPSDFMILTARKSELVHYQQALAEVGIACEASLDPMELSLAGKELLRFFEVLANPDDRIALVGVLRGGLFGHSDSELFAHFQNLGCPAVEETLQFLRELRESMRTLPPGSAAHFAVGRLGLQGEEVSALVGYFRQRGQQGLTLAQAVRELWEIGSIPRIPGLGGAGPGQTESQTQSGVMGPGALPLVMNVHKAKGLEARVVILAAPTVGLPTYAEHTVYKGEGALCLRRNRKPLAHPIDWNQLEQRELEFVVAEQRRLLYVAATRAREHLIVGQWDGSHGSVIRPWALLEPFLSDCEILVPTAQAPLETGAQGRGAVEIEASALLPSWRRLSVSGHSGQTGQLSLEGSGPGGAAWGDLIHRLLEQMVKRPSLTRDELARLARWYLLETPELQEHLEEVLDCLERIRQSEFWARVLAAGQRLVEVPFGHRTGNDYLFGIVDLALAGTEGWSIVDYKTDRKRLEDLVASYARQVNQYAESWSEVGGQAVDYAGIFGVREGQLSADVRK